MPAFFMSGLSCWSPSCLGLHTGWFGHRCRRLLGRLLRQWRQGNVAAVFVFGVAVQDQQHVDVAAVAGERIEIGRASCRERVCQSVSISVVAVSLKKKITKATKRTEQRK